MLNQEQRGRVWNWNQIGSSRRGSVSSTFLEWRHKYTPNEVILLGGNGVVMVIKKNTYNTTNYDSNYHAEMTRHDATHFTTLSHLILQ